MRQRTASPSYNQITTYYSVIKEGASHLRRTRYLPPVTNLVIGSSKRPTTKKIRNVTLAILVTAVLTGLLAVGWKRTVHYSIPEHGKSSAEKSSLVHQPNGEYALSFGNSSIRYVGTVPVIRIEGTPSDAGEAYARLLPNRLRDPLGQIDNNYGIYSGGFLHKLQKQWQFRHLDEAFNQDETAWLGGLWRGLNVKSEDSSVESALYLSTVMDIGAPSIGSVGASVHAMARSSSVLTTTHGTNGHRLLIGRSFSPIGLRYSSKLPPPAVVIDKTKEVPFASLTWPHAQGVVSGMNAFGIAITVHPSKTQSKPRENSTSTVLLAERILATARDSEEALQLLVSTKTLGSAVYLIANGTSRTWKVVEKTPARTVVLDKSPLFVSGRLTSPVFAEDPHVERASRHSQLQTREARAKGWTERFKSGLAEMMGGKAEDVNAFEVDEIPEEMEGTADRVLIFRSMHGLNIRNNADDVLKAARKLLKDDGMVGVVQHRAPKGASWDDYVGRQRGYLPQETVIAIFKANGFELAKESEINANPKDPANWERGVWTLPPVLATGADDPKRSEYLAIGESDRMTLLFKKAD